MFGIKMDYRPDRSRQEAIIERMRKSIRRNAQREAEKRRVKKVSEYIKDGKTM